MSVSVFWEINPIFIDKKPTNTLYVSKRGTKYQQGGQNLYTKLTNL